VTAASRMVANSITALVVVRGSHPIGIITERLITRAVADEVDPVLTSAAEYMSPDPTTVRPDDDTDAVTERMLELGVRHFPIVEGNGTLAGMISARDLLALDHRPSLQDASSRR
jgi:CBS domain-containing protein